jgi:hypothetical protein
MSSPGEQANSERESLLHLLRRTEVLYLAELENVSPEQAAFKQRPDRWSIAEIAEHVAIAEEFMYKRAAGASPSTEESDPRIDERIHRLAADRGRAFPAPEDVCPRGRFGSVAESAARLRRPAKNNRVHKADASGFTAIARNASYGKHRCLSNNHRVTEK